MGRGLLQGQLCRRADRRLRRYFRELHKPCRTRGLLGQLWEEPPLRAPPLVLTRHSVLHRWLPIGQNIKSLIVEEPSRRQSTPRSWKALQPLTGSLLNFVRREFFCTEAASLVRCVG